MLQCLGKAGLSIGLVIFGSLLGGCSGDPYKNIAPVTGRVLCDGKPAAGGTVIFMPIDAPEKTGRSAGNVGLPSTGMVGDDGRFTLLKDIVGTEKRQPHGALVGPHQVLFLPPRTTPATPSALDRSVLSPEELAAYVEELKKVPVFPPLPCDNTISPDVVEVQSGNNEFEFVLAPAPASPPKHEPAPFVEPGSPQ